MEDLKTGEQASKGEESACDPWLGSHACYFDLYPIISISIPHITTMMKKAITKWSSCLRVQRISG